MSDRLKVTNAIALQHLSDRASLRPKCLFRFLWCFLKNLDVWLQ
ncbi:hypothetical protein [Trichocoleus sp. FACHB-40]|nr:hypothetical protein [Trichocoleus sp. FACHB-40]